MERIIEEAGVGIIKPETRRKIIEILTSELSYRQVARSLGVTAAAIHKYITGKSTPRDEVVKRAIDLAAELGLTEVGDLILEDIATELEALLKTLAEKDLASAAHVSKLSSIVGRAKLVLAAGLSGNKKRI
ncbi:MAG: hypothetical protein F7C37_03390 [Desulfurococcales archaeon]|nr:hypothetical protein [Desulfurococcales archaeon]MCE4623053.1 hypothetical protein [Desulfurococcales archaeon]MCE4626537.1 hypothetical protein [Desulfurococcales archaeon]